MIKWAPFVEPVGGIMALLPLAIADRWEGALGPEGDIADYDKLADALGEYASVREVYGTAAIVFAGDRTPTAWCQNDEGSLIVVRIIFGPDDSVILRAAQSKPEKRPDWIVTGIPLTAGMYRLIDVAAPASDQSRKMDTVNLTPAQYVLSTWEVDVDTETRVILHWIEEDRTKGGDRNQ
jgi:hypothetical protein